MIEYDENIANKVSENTYWWIVGGINQAVTKEQEREILEDCKCFFQVRRIFDMNGDTVYWRVS